MCWTPRPLHFEYEGEMGPVDVALKRESQKNYPFLAFDGACELFRGPRATLRARHSVENLMQEMAGATCDRADFDQVLDKMIPDLFGPDIHGERHFEHGPFCRLEVGELSGTSALSTQITDSTTLRHFALRRGKTICRASIVRQGLGRGNTRAGNSMSRRRPRPGAGATACVRRT